MKRLILLCITLFSLTANAQIDAIRHIAKQASAARLKVDVYALAGDKMEGRMMGNHGDTLAAGYVAAAFKKAQVAGPYDDGKSYFQTIHATRYIDSGKLSFNNNSYKELDGWQVFPEGAFSSGEVPILLNNFITVEDWNKWLPKLSLNGTAVMISGSLFSDFSRLDSLENALVAKGVKMVLWTGSKALGQIDFRKEYAFFPNYKVPASFAETGPIHEVAITSALLQKLSAPEQIKFNTDGNFVLPKDSAYIMLSTKISVQLKRDSVDVTAPNVIGIIKGTDPAAGAVILSAHHDHQGRFGKTIYYGAVDNASGTASIMEIARLLNEAALKGYRPKRTIIIGSWTGEERGLLGSFYYRDHPIIPINQMFAVLNMDMLGRIDTLHLKQAKIDSNYAYILVRDTLHVGLRQALYKADESVGINLDKYYEQPKYMMRRLMGSDQFPFYEKGVPFVRIDCGFAKEYHKPEDTPDKLIYPLLARQTQLAFLTIWNIANL